MGKSNIKNSHLIQSLNIRNHEIYLSHQRTKLSGGARTLFHGHLHCRNVHKDCGDGIRVTSWLVPSERLEYNGLHCGCIRVRYQVKVCAPLRISSDFFQCWCQNQKTEKQLGLISQPYERCVFFGRSNLYLVSQVSFCSIVWKTKTNQLRFDRLAGCDVSDRQSYWSSCQHCSSPPLCYHNFCNHWSRVLCWSPQ